MRTRIACLAALVVLSAVSLGQQPKKKKCTAGDGNYCVYRATNRTCKVWTDTTTLGEELLGPFEKEDDAVLAMCKVYVPGTYDAGKCAFTDPADACQKAQSKAQPTPERSPS